MLAPFLITFREGLEAALVIAIIAAYLVKIERKELKKYVCIGAVVAILVSILIGYVVLITYGELEGTAEQLFEGISSLLATVILTLMVFWMAKNAKNIKDNLHKKIDSIINKKYIFGMIFLSFIVVFKEGVETVLFLTASYGMDSSGTLVGTMVGFAIILIITILILKETVRLPLQKFFKYTGILLIVFAAGLFGSGIHEFIEVGQGMGINLGFWDEHAYDINPSDSTNTLHEEGSIGSIFKALIGYDGNPENLRVAGYIIYWLVIGGLFIRMYKKISFREVVRNKIKRGKK